MKILIKSIALSLALILCISWGAFTVTAESPEPPQSEWEYINRLHQLIRDLERDLADAENNPNQPNPRRPVIQITDPLMIEIEAGSSRVVEFNIANLASDTATSVITTANLTNAEGIGGEFTDRNNNIASMGNRAQRTFSYRITVNANAEEGFHTIVFNHTFLNAYNVSLTNESRVSIRVVRPSDRGATLRNIASSVSQVPPGTNFDLTAVIHNESSGAIRNVSMTITEGMASDGIFLRDSTNVVSLATMTAGQSENISIGFRADSRARRGAYPLTLQLEYTDARGERQTQSHVFFVNVGTGASDEGSSEVVITNITAPSGHIGVGQEFQMTVTLRNQSSYPANNIRVDAASGSDGAIVPRSTSILQINNLAPGEEHSLNFSFAPTSSARTQNYAIGFSVRYETGREDSDGNNETITFTQYQGINVTNPDEDDDEPERTSTPRIIISDFRSTPMIVQAGHEFDLDIEFLNTSDRVVRNIMITLTVEEEIIAGSNNNERRGSVFTPVGRSNTFFINRIEPGASVTEHIRYFTLPDAPPRNYVINVDFKYEDEDNNPFEARGSIGINVAQVTRFDTSEIFVPDFAQAFQPIFINFEIYNTGRVILSNLMVRVEGDFSAQQSSVFFGSLNPGSMDFYDNVLMPIDYGMLEGAIVFTFEDDTGRQIEERREFVVDVSPPPAFDDDMIGRPPMDGNMVWDDNLGMFVPASQGPGIGTLLAIVLGGAVIVGASAFVGLRIRKKRMESMVDIDE